jgi:hypothetical protein
MKTILRTISFLALAGTLAAPLAYFFDALTLPRTQMLLLLCAILWFATVPFWMEHKAAD